MAVHQQSVRKRCWFPVQQGRRLRLCKNGRKRLGVCGQVKHKVWWLPWRWALCTMRFTMAWLRFLIPLFLPSR